MKDTPRLHRHRTHALDINREVSSGDTGLEETQLPHSFQRHRNGGAAKDGSGWSEKKSDPGSAFVAKQTVFRHISVNGRFKVAHIKTFSVPTYTHTAYTCPRAKHTCVQTKQKQTGTNTLDTMKEN